jgi:hypothetical protein
MNLVILLLFALAAALAVVSLLRPRHELVAVAVIVLAIAGALPLLAALG